MMQGGGSEPHTGVKVYVLFAGRSFASADIKELVEKFKRTAKYTNNDIGAELVDLDTDSRLKAALAATPEGQQLFGRIEQMVPVICVSTSFIGDAYSASKVELLRMRDVENDSDKLFSAIETKMTRSAERKGFIEFLKFMDSIGTYKPGMFGIKLDLSKALKRVIARLET